MKIFCFFFVFLLTCSSEKDCENLEITTTVDKPGNVMKNGLLQPNWFLVPYKSFMESERITFFIKGLSPDQRNSSLIHFFHDDQQENLQKRWVKAEVIKTYSLQNNPGVFCVELLQECLVRDGWRATNMSLVLGSGKCQRITWPRTCGSPSRVLSSFNLGFLEHTSELIANGVVESELFDVHADVLTTNKGRYLGSLYLWSSFEENLDIEVNVSYVLKEEKKVLGNRKEIKGKLENNTFSVNINFNCSSSFSGEKSISLALSLIHLHTFNIFYKFKCPEQSSSSFFKTFLLLILFLFLVLLFSVLILRNQDTISSLPMKIKSLFSPKIKSSYLPDREFPDIEFSDLTFKSPSQAYGTF
jgi:hypothetical protein